MIKKDVLVSHCGCLKFETINELLRQLKMKLDSMDVDLNIRRRVYSVMVECLENIFKHTDCRTIIPHIANKKDFDPRFSVTLTNDNFILLSSNLVSEKDREIISQQIDMLNHLTKKEINELYKEKITSNTISEKGGAGLGLIEIARNSLSTIKYDFLPVSERYWYFELIVTISKKKL